MDNWFQKQYLSNYKLITPNKNPMWTQKYLQTHSFTLVIHSITLHINFPCKMILQYNHEELSAEIIQNQHNTFIFNQQLILKQDPSSDHLQVMIHLHTEQNRRYIAGHLSLDKYQLTRKKGEHIVVKLRKCFDQKACCTLLVKQVMKQNILVNEYQWQKKQKVHTNKNKLEIPNLQDKYNNTRLRRQQSKKHKQTKSQLQFPLSLSHQNGEYNSKKKQNFSIYEPRALTPNSNIHQTNHQLISLHIDKYLPQFGVTDQPKKSLLLQQSLYKQTYQTLKQKYKTTTQSLITQHSTLLALQSTHQTLQLQLLKSKLEQEQLQLALQGKNKIIQELREQIGTLKNIQCQFLCYKEEMGEKTNAKTEESTVKNMITEINDTKTEYQQILDKQQRKTRQLQTDLTTTKQKYQSKLAEIQQELEQKLAKIGHQEQAIRTHQENIRKLKRVGDSVEKTSQKKIQEYEKRVKSVQNQYKSKLLEYERIISKLQKQNIELVEDIHNRKTQQQNMKSIILKLQHQKKIMSQQLSELQIQLPELRILKQKNKQLLITYQLLNEQKTNLSIQLDQSMKNTDINLCTLRKQHQLQIDNYKKIQKKEAEHLRASQTKLTEIQSGLERKKNENEKLRKSKDILVLQCNELKDKEKFMKKCINEKQQQLERIRIEFEAYRCRTINEKQVKQYNIENTKEQLYQLQREIDKQTLKSTQLLQKIQHLTSQLNKSQIHVSHLTDKLQKDTQTHRQKTTNLQNSNRDNQKTITQLTNLINALRSSDRQSQTKLQNLQHQTILNQQRTSTFQTQLKTHHQQNTKYEQQLQIKQLQLNTILTAKQQLERKILKQEQIIKQMENNSKIATEEKNKYQIIIVKLNAELNQVKNASEQVKKKNQNIESSSASLRQQLNKISEEYSKLQTENDALKKQYNSFKQNLLQTLSTSYQPLPPSNPQINPNTHSLSQTNPKFIINPQYIQSPSFNTDLLANLTTQASATKLAFIKLTDQQTLTQKQLQNQLNINSTYLANQQRLNTKIQQLNQQLSRLCNEKQKQSLANRATIHELQLELEQHKDTNKERMGLIEELKYTINTLKMDQQAIEQHYNAKFAKYKERNEEMQQRINLLDMMLLQSQNRCKNMQQQLNKPPKKIQYQRIINNKKQISRTTKQITYDRPITKIINQNTQNKENNQQQPNLQVDTHTIVHDTTTTQYKILSDKISKLEEQKLLLLNTKNAEIQQLINENNLKLSVLKSKETTLRKLEHELQIGKSALAKSESSRYECEQQLNQINKTYQNQLDKLKIIGSPSSSYPPLLEKTIINLEREVKQIIDNYIEKINANNQSNYNQKIAQNIKTVGEEIICVIRLKKQGNIQKK